MITLSFGTSFLVKKKFPLHRINHKKGIKKLISIKIITQSFFFFMTSNYKVIFFFSSALFLDFLIHFLYFHHKKKKKKVSVIKLNSCKVTILISYFPSFFIFIFFFIFLIKALHLICHHKYRLVS